MDVRAPALLWTAAQAAAADRHTIETLGIPSPVLMERAALAVSAVVQRELSQRSGADVAGPVVVLCGPGNNGGDGVAVARQLHGRGVDARVLLATRRRSPTVEAQVAMARTMGVAFVTVDDLIVDEVALWVDALLGTGSRGAPRGGVETALAAVVGSGAPVVSIDVPTGVDPDGGSAHSGAIRAVATVTIERSKSGLHVTPGSQHSGRVVVATIGLRPAPDSETAAMSLIDPVAVWRWLDALGPAAHKGERGRVVCFGGSPGTAGAVVLAGGAALRAGAGLVTVASFDSDTAGEALRTRPELMVAHGPVNGAWNLPADAHVVGPGVTRDSDAHALTPAWTDNSVPAVWDAGALGAIVGRSPAHRVITPHPKEAAALLQRLTGDAWTTGRVQAERLVAARELAMVSGAVVVLKGAGTIVASGERIAICVAGSSALATAGSGDVLAGVIAALLGRGLGPWEAACAGVHLHARAGERLGQDAGSLASDIADEVGAMLSETARDRDATGWPEVYSG